MRNNNPIQIFEHDKLLIGEQGFEQSHWDALGWYNEKHGGDFFTLTPKGVKFNQYVGVIQVGNITIEILPKISKVGEDKEKWQKVLIDMLRECRWMQVYSNDTASLRFKPNSILEAYDKAKFYLKNEDKRLKIAINGFDFVKKYHLEGLRESLFLDYPSYILALAMGAGKTVLIGSIIATEFAMALEYPDGSFVKNALVFAPGKTILGALKEISDIPYEKILPPRLYKQFISTLKITYTRDGEKDIPIIKGSSFNIVVTNTEKIRIQKQNITKSLLQGILLNKEREDEIKEAVANQRIQTIASLPNLAIFSDEAHHTYGQEMLAYIFFEP